MISEPRPLIFDKLWRRAFELRDKRWAHVLLTFRKGDSGFCSLQCSGGGGVLTSLVNRKVCVSSGKLVLSPSSGPRLGQDQGRNLETRVVWKGSNQGEDGAVWGCSHGPFCSNT